MSAPSPAAPTPAPPGGPIGPGLPKPMSWFLWVIFVIFGMALVGGAFSLMAGSTPQDSSVDAADPDLAVEGVPAVGHLPAATPIAPVIIPAADEILLSMTGPTFCTFEQLPSRPGEWTKWILFPSFREEPNASQEILPNPHNGYVVQTVDIYGRTAEVVVPANGRVEVAFEASVGRKADGIAKFRLRGLTTGMACRVELTRKQ